MALRCIVFVFVCFVLVGCVQRDSVTAKQFLYDNPEYTLQIDDKIFDKFSPQDDVDDE